MCKWAYLEVRLAHVLVLLHVEPEVEGVFGGFALEEDLSVRHVLSGNLWLQGVYTSQLRRT